MKVGMTFEKANIIDVLKVFSRLARVTIVPDPNLQGTVTIISPDQMTLQEAFDVLQGVLAVQNYQMQGKLTDKIIKVVPLTTGRFGASAVGKEPKEIDPTKPPSAASVPSNDDMVTWIIPVKYAQASRLVTSLQRLVNPNTGVIAADTDSNTLIVVDTAANVKRIAQVVRELDVDQSTLFGLEVIKLQYAYAPSVLDTISRVFGVSTSGQRPSTTTTAGPRIEFGPGGPFPPGMPGGPGGPTGSTGARPGVVELRGDTLISADERMNAILVSAPKDRIELIKTVVKQLDVDVAPDVEYRIFTLKNADATQIADILNEIFEQPQGGPPSASQRRSAPTFEQRVFGGFNPFGGQQRPTTSRQTQNYGYAGLKENVVIPDVRTNSILVTAAKGNIPAFEKMVEELDKETTFTELTRVYRLQNAKAEELADTLNYVFSGQAPRGQRTTLTSRTTVGGGRTTTGGTGQLFRQPQPQQTFGSGSTVGGGFGGQSARPQQLEGAAEEFLRRVVVVPEAKTNSLIITAPLQARPLIEQLIAELDQRTPQVFIEVLIADVTLTNQTQFSLEYAIESLIRGDSLAGTQTFGGGALNPSDPFHGTGIGTGTGGFRFSVITDSGKFQALMRALATNTNVKVLSRPQVTTLDNVPATISIGQQFPYVSGIVDTTTGSRAEVQFADIAIRLDVTPHVSIQDLIQMDIVQTVNELVQIVTPSPGQQAPVIGTREANTSVQVKSGQTIVLGGIIRDSDSRTINKVPFLGDLPLIGGLFRSTDKTRSRTELMIFLTPYVVRDDEGIDAKTAAARKELSVPDLRLPMPALKSLNTPDRRNGQKADEAKKAEPPKEEPKKEGKS
jgi:general secretion pathway protein D